MTWKLKARHAALAASASLAMIAAPSQQAQASTNTLAILGNSMAAYPSCFEFEVKGMCFFLYCTTFYCTIRASLLVSHYVPDAIVSTYNEVTLHPWGDIARVVAVPSTALGSWLMGTAWSDSSAGNISEATQFTYFKSADAYGNPAGLILQWVTGSMGNVTATFGVPGVNNLMGFVQHELPRIPGMWASVPADLLNSVMGGTMDLLKKPQELIEAIQKVPGLLQGGQSALGLMGGLTPAKVLNLVGIDIGPLMDVYNAIKTLSDGAGSFLSIGPETLCPGSASLLTLHFQSELDNLFWRGILPVESLYPGSWLPLGHNEVGSWGSRYPRTGELVQQDPTRASAVIAERVMSIISQENQPHIYTELKAQGNYVYFGPVKQRKWQRHYPDAEQSCQTFGGTLKNYSMSERSVEDGYVWGAWNPYTCCLRRGIFLFSVGAN